MSRAVSSPAYHLLGIISLLGLFRLTSGCILAFSSGGLSVSTGGYIIYFNAVTGWDTYVSVRFVVVVVSMTEFGIV